MKKEKFLIIRFSSIGDIVFTTPVIRCLRKRYPNSEIHFLTKPENKIILQYNPYLDKIFTLQPSLMTTIADLKKEDYHAVIDLHHNIRSFLIKAALLKPSYTVQKLNWEKFLLIHFRCNILPAHLHITERNLAAIQAMDVENDREGMDYFIGDENEVDVQQYGLKNNAFVAWVVGAKHFTKVLPSEKTTQAISYLLRTNPSTKIALIGSHRERDAAEKLQADFSRQVVNLCGLLNLNQSASVLKHSSVVVAGDTGLLHIAVALGRPVVSLWGSTIPEFGVFPLYGKGKEQPLRLIEIKNLPCRPCSRFGKSACPKKHFKCMNDIDAAAVAAAVNEVMNAG
jgi:ADP-heptose:LPS heptosyltransferase